MKPLFTIHAGEFIFGEHIEKHFKNLNLWIPSKDTGIDFLITNTSNSKVKSAQVKMSKNYLSPLAKTDFEKSLKAAGWFRFSHIKLENSQADIWSLILISHDRKRNPAFINAAPKKLLDQLIKIHGKKDHYDIHPWLLIPQGNQEIRKEICIEGRGLNKNEKRLLSTGHFDPDRNLSKFYDNWEFLKKLDS